MNENPEGKRRPNAPGRASDNLSDPNNQIASKLKALYSVVEAEPIPDMFLDLLEKLDHVEQTTRADRK